MSSIKVEKIGATDVEVQGGFSNTEIYIGFLENFILLTEPKERTGTDAAANLTELITITADHTFKEGFGFTKIAAIEETVSLECTQAGNPTMSTTSINKLTVQLLGSGTEVLGFKRLCRGRQLIILANEQATGNLRQIGSAKYAGQMIESSSKIDALAEGDNAVTFVFQDKQKYDAPIYTGIITPQPTVG